MDRLAVRGPLVQAAFNRDQIRERCPPVHREAGVADQHLIGVLRTKVNFRRRVGIEWIVGGIISGR